MGGLIDQLVQWGERLVEMLGYVGLVLIMLAENVFPPIPSEPFLLGAGFASANGTMSMPLAILAATIGATAGALLYYYVGVLLPEARIRSLLRSHGKYLLLGESDLDRAMTWFRRYGPAVVFFGRCIPLVRTLISVPAGLTRMRLPVFLAYTAAGTAAWSTLLIVLGRAFGENYEAALSLLDRFEGVLVAAMAVGAVAFVALRVRSRLRARAAARRGENDPTPPEDGPVRPETTSSAAMSAPQQRGDSTE